MSKTKDHYMQVEQERLADIQDEADARYQTIMEELASGSLTREECISHEEELEISQDI